MTIPLGLVRAAKPNTRPDTKNKKGFIWSKSVCLFLIGNENSKNIVKRKVKRASVINKVDWYIAKG